MHARLALLVAAVVSLILLVWHFQPTEQAAKPLASATPSPGNATSGTLSAMGGTPVLSESVPTTVYAHNLILRKGPNFRIYVRWLRGQMIRTRRSVNPSFDDPESFFRSEEHTSELQ